MHLFLGYMFVKIFLFFPFFNIWLGMLISVQTTRIFVIIIVVVDRKRLLCKLIIVSVQSRWSTPWCDTNRLWNHRHVESFWLLHARIKSIILLLRERRNYYNLRRLLHQLSILKVFVRIGNACRCFGSRWKLLFGGFFSYWFLRVQCGICEKARGKILIIQSVLAVRWPIARLWLDGGCLRIPCWHYLTLELRKICR